MKFPYTGIILAGGQNLRFNGKNKASIKICGKSIIEHIYDLFSQIFEQVIIVTNDPIKYIKFDCHIVCDIYEKRSALTGIHTGLFYTKTPFAFIVACDLPFLKRQVVELIINNIDKKNDIVICETQFGLEPLCAVYSKRCIKSI